MIGHIVSVARKQRERHADSQLSFSFLFNLEPSPWDAAHSQFQLNLWCHLKDLEAQRETERWPSEPLV